MPPVERKNCPVCASSERRRLFEKEGGVYFQCSSCALVYADPATGEAELRAIADEWAESHHGSSEKLEWEKDDRIARVLHERRMRILERYRSTGAILDVGCSTGMFLAYAASKGWTPHGCEIASYTAKIARERIGENARHGSFGEMKYDSSRFDCVTMWDVLEHTIDPGAFVAEAFRVLRPGGLLIVATPNYGSLSRRALGEKWEALYPTRHLEVFDPSNLRRLIESRGGRVTITRTIDVNPFEIVGGVFGRGGNIERRKSGVSKMKKLFADHPSLGLARDGLNAILSVTRLGDAIEMYAEKI